MAPRSSKKSQADLISMVKAAGWKEDSKTAGDKHIRWWHPNAPEQYFTLRNAAQLTELQKSGVHKRELVKEARA